MRAARDTREREVVEGILYLRYVGAWGGYVQVDVLTGGAALSVVPSTIEVLEADAVSHDDIEAGDPLRDEPGHRRFVSLQDVADAGLLPEIRERHGGTWADMHAALRLVAKPLIAAGWDAGETDAEESWEHSDSVFLDLARGDVAIQLELYEDGWLVAYRTDYEYDPDTEPPDPYFTADGTDAAEVLEAFRAQGWLSQTAEGEQPDAG